MSYKSFQFVLTLVATNEKNYKDCIAFIQNIFNDRKVSSAKPLKGKKDKIKVKKNNFFIILWLFISY